MKEYEDITYTLKDGSTTTVKVPKRTQSDNNVDSTSEEIKHLLSDAEAEASRIKDLMIPPKELREELGYLFGGKSTMEQLQEMQKTPNSDEVEETTSINSSISNPLEAKTEPMTELNNNQNMIYCRYCGKQIPSDSAYCLHCGKQLKEHKENLFTLGKFSKKTKICTFVYVLYFFIVWFLILGKHSRWNNDSTMAFVMFNLIVPMCVYGIFYLVQYFKNGKR